MVWASTAAPRRMSPGDTAWVTSMTRTFGAIWAITPQNEPLQPTADYPGMFLSASQEATFVHDHLRPAMVAAGLGAVRIYGYDYTLTTGPATEVTVTR